MGANLAIRVAFLGTPLGPPQSMASNAFHRAPSDLQDPRCSRARCKKGGAGGVNAPCNVHGPNGPFEACLIFDIMENMEPQLNPKSLGKTGPTSPVL